MARFIYSRVWRRPRHRYVPLSRPGIFGSASITTDADTISAAGVLALVGTLGVTEANDSVSSVGTLPGTATGSITEANDIISAASTLSLTGASAITEAGDTVSSEGTAPDAAGIAVGSSSTLTYGTRTDSTITAPSAIANGNVLVAVLHVGDATALPALAVTPPAGWTELTGSPVALDRADPYTLSLRFYGKVASGESGDYTFTHTSAQTEGIIYRITGADTTSSFTPNPVTNNFQDLFDGQLTTGLSITTVRDGSLVIMASDAWDGPGLAVPPTGTTPTFTERYKGSAVYFCDGVMATAGATGDKTHVNGNGSQGLPWTSVMIAVQPALFAGASAITEASDTVSAVGTLALTGVVDKTEAGDTVASVGTLALTGAAAIVEAGDTLLAADLSQIFGALALTEANDSVSAVGVLAITGTLAVSEAADTLSAISVNATTGAAALIEVADSISSTGTLAITGIFAKTEQNDIVVAVENAASPYGRLGLLLLFGTGSYQGILGIGVVTEGSDTVASTSTIALSGTAAIHEGNDTVVASSSSNIIGAAAIVERNDTVVAASTVALVGAAAITEGNDFVVGREVIPISSGGPGLMLAIGLFLG